MENLYQECLKNLEKLRKNRENVPSEMLRTKYRVPYQNLLLQIKSATKNLVHAYIFSALVFNPAEKGAIQEFTDRANRILKEEEDAGTFRKISHAVFLEYDLKKALDIVADKIIPRIWLEAYADYWLSHCIRRNGCPIYNDLIKMEWDDKLQLWVGPDKASWTLMLPPTRDLMDAEKERMQFMIGEHLIVTH